jgi:hypothetical protein
VKSELNEYHTPLCLRVLVGDDMICSKLVRVTGVYCAGYVNKVLRFVGSIKGAACD